MMVVKHLLWGNHFGTQVKKLWNGRPLPLKIRSIGIDHTLSTGLLDSLIFVFGHILVLLFLAKPVNNFVDSRK
jgi:hypothetical protein